MSNAISSVFFIQVDNRFGVASRGITGTAASQTGTDRCMIIDFAVEDNPNGPILVGHRLVASAQIHNAESPEPEGHGRTEVVSNIVRSAVNEHLGHGFK